MATTYTKIDKDTVEIKVEQTAVQKVKISRTDLENKIAKLNQQIAELQNILDTVLI